MYKTLIKLVVHYDHDTWIMLKEDLQALVVFRRWVVNVANGFIK